MLHLDDAIRERAYHLWVADGRADGNPDLYWIKAQRELLAQSLNDDSSTFAQTSRSEPVASETTYPAKKAKATAVRKSKRRAA